MVYNIMYTVCNTSVQEFSPVSSVLMHGQYSVSYFRVRVYMCD